MTSLTAVDLFAGAGGLSVGLRRAGFRVTAAVELDACSANTYRMNHRDTAMLVRDIRRVTGPELLRVAGLKRGELDLLTGCPPCQGYSTLRTKRRCHAVQDPRNDLLLEFLRLVRSTRPRAVVLENVPGLAQDVAFQSFCDGLRGAGYSYQHAVVDAAEFGVPQRRRRLVLVASRVREVSVTWWARKRSRQVTVAEALTSLLPAGRSGDPLHDLPERRSKTVMQRIRSTPRDGGSRSSVRGIRCVCHSTTNGFYDVYGRMAWEQVAPTITSGCSNPSKGRFIHPSEHRAITLREAALLQAFPRRYRFDLSRGKEHVASQIGNAFPPPLILPIARKLARELS